MQRIAGRLFCGAVGFAGCVFPATVATEPKSDRVIHGYKAVRIDFDGIWYAGWDSNMKFKAGGTHTVSSSTPVKMCDHGFHGCIHPQHCLKYYKGWERNTILVPATFTGDIIVGPDKIVASTVTLGERPLTPDEIKDASAKAACNSVTTDSYVDDADDFVVEPHVVTYDEKGEFHSHNGKPALVRVRDGRRLFFSHGQHYHSENAVKA